MTPTCQSWLKKIFSDPIPLFSEVGGEFVHQRPGIDPGVLVPLHPEKLVQGVMVNGLFLVPANTVQELDEPAGENRRCPSSCRLASITTTGILSTNST